MDISLETIALWKIEAEMPPRIFLPAVTPLLAPGDVAMFGTYEPTEELSLMMRSLGATRHTHLDGYWMSFDFNRTEHPDGCAFRYVLGENAFEDLLKHDDSLLRQKDVLSFYDHFLAFRPGTPGLPLMTFHDAACGGTFYLSGHYTKSDMEALGKRLSHPVTRIQNPVLNIAS